MTISNNIGAPETIYWNLLDLDNSRAIVRKLQLRIARAIRENRWNKAKALQHLLTKSFHAKLLAVHKVTTNKGKNTPGVDGIVWNSNKAKTKGLYSLLSRGYKPKPLRRVYIPKANGKQRPLGIPTMKDRAMQALYAMALEPIAEVTADVTSYGFRPKRSAKDAIAQCWLCLHRRTNSQWVLDADIKACFDNISHDWLLENIPMNKGILKKWLTSGYIFKDQYFRTEEGTPQGGIISPILANMCLDGLSKELKRNTSLQDKVNLIRYADDFIVTGVSKATIESKVIPIVKNFLKIRGLKLSEEKTRIVHINDGFNFLGFNVRKYRDKLLIKPSKESVKNLLHSIRYKLKIGLHTSQEGIVNSLNPRIRGWSYYFRSVVSKETFSYVDGIICKKLIKWCKKKHPTKSYKWIKNKYFKTIGFRSWIFSPKSSDLQIMLAAKVPIKRHRLIMHNANIYDLNYDNYFKERDAGNIYC
ncbi:group II intron reverse transcriptase/maturase [Cysteiniphilum marinum]|uniref:group II intron reverse transcriptase/maturase n=5 Tax=Fastidiosibacteraceae TaxID=2056687 RepID=UPI00193B723C|nr:group II intron reverse transcriptase/maturase [Cysteiniphilum marinum]